MVASAAWCEGNGTPEPPDSEGLPVSSLLDEEDLLTGPNGAPDDDGEGPLGGGEEDFQIELPPGPDGGDPDALPLEGAELELELDSGAPLGTEEEESPAARLVDEELDVLGELPDDTLAELDPAALSIELDLTELDDPEAVEEETIPTLEEFGIVVDEPTRPSEHPPSH